MEGIFFKTAASLMVLICILFCAYAEYLSRREK